MPEPHRLVPEPTQPPILHAAKAISSGAASPMRPDTQTSTAEIRITGFVPSLPVHYHGFVLSKVQAQRSCILLYYRCNPKDHLNEKLSATSLNTRFMSIKLSATSLNIRFMSITKTDPLMLFIAIIIVNKQTNK